MKNIKYTIAALSLFLAIGCTSDDANFNDNQDRAYDVPAETLVANAQYELVGQMTTSSVNLSPFRYFTQYWAQTQYFQESRYNLTQRNIPVNLWNNLYRDVLGNLVTAEKVIDGESKPVLQDQAEFTAQQANKKAIIELMKVYTFQVLVDTFGDVPYSEALDPTIVLPKYDDDAVIYPDLLVRVNAALAILDANAPSFSSGDGIYAGDVSGWINFGNSLKVKIGINLADVNTGLAKTAIESAVTAGVITQNSQNAFLKFSQGPPLYNPIYADLVASGRNDYVASATIVDALTALDDPRLSVYFSPVVNTTTYTGGVNGVANLAQFFSPIGEVFRTPDFAGQLFEATEMNFYLAEAAARGYSVGGTADMFYDDAIMASFEFWGLTPAQATAYLAMPEVAYATADGDWKKKIGTQAWLALFNRPFESWTSIRRLDQPEIIAPSNAVAAAQGKMPKRFTYPTSEVTVNKVNLDAAKIAIGGDKLQTKVFWDIF